MLARRIVGIDPDGALRRESETLAASGYATRYAGPGAIAEPADRNEIVVMSGAPPAAAQAYIAKTYDRTGREPCVLFACDTLDAKAEHELMCSGVADVLIRSREPGATLVERIKRLHRGRIPSPGIINLYGAGGAGKTENALLLFRGVRFHRSDGSPGALLLKSVTDRPPRVEVPAPGVEPRADEQALSDSITVPGKLEFAPFAQAVMDRDLDWSSMHGSNYVTPITEPGLVLLRDQLIAQRLPVRPADLESLFALETGLQEGYAVITVAGSVETALRRYGATSTLGYPTVSILITSRRKDEQVARFLRKYTSTEQYLSESTRQAIVEAYRASRLDQDDADPTAFTRLVQEIAARQSFPPEMPIYVGNGFSTPLHRIRGLHHTEQQFTSLRHLDHHLESETLYGLHNKLLDVLQVEPWA